MMNSESGKDRAVAGLDIARDNCNLGRLPRYVNPPTANPSSLATISITKPERTDRGQETTTAGLKSLISPR